MSPGIRGMVAFLAMVSSLTSPRAAAVEVRDSDGRPVANVLVTCLGREDGAALTNDEGRAMLPDACKRVSCARGGYLQGKARLVAGGAVCRVSRGVSMTVALPAPGCGEGCQAALTWETRGVLRGSTAEFQPGAEPEPQSEPEPVESLLTARLAPVEPGTYQLAVVRIENLWTCRTTITLSEIGERTVRGVWREPLKIRGFVILADGRPGADIPVRVKDSAPEAAVEKGVWRCGTFADQKDVFTGLDGSFVIPIDGEGGCEIEAGSSWDADGYASVTISGIPSSTLRLNLTK